MREYFPFSEWYAPAGPCREQVARERPVRGRVFGYSERHVQAVWYDPAWRPASLATSAGEEVQVEFPGRWNVEAGPDFLGAALRVGPDRRRLEGDVEVHVFPAEWRQHRHAEDPRYRRVIAHVTYFEGQLEASELPPGALQLALRPGLKRDPSFAFEHVDVTAYPYAGRADVPPCRGELSAWTAEEKTALFVAAGQARLRLKAERFAEAVAERGVDQVLYEGVLSALGYQHNKRPFLGLASRLPVDALRAIAQGESRRAYAVLAGLSGLLPDGNVPSWDDATRRFVREVWDIWWRERGRLPEGLARTDWRLHGIRPLNHPLRRMMAAAVVFTRPASGPRLLESWLRADAAESLDALTSAFSGDDAPYWPRRTHLGAAPGRNGIALLGRDRLDALLVNVVLPMAAACGFDAGRVRRCLATLRPEPMNQIMKQAAYYLLGPDYPSRLLAAPDRRQGVMQIFHDHCLHDRSQCARCAFPAWLASARKPAPAGS